MVEKKLEEYYKMDEKGLIKVNNSVSAETLLLLNKAACARQFPSVDLGVTKMDLQF